MSDDPVDAAADAQTPRTEARPERETPASPGAPSSVDRRAFFRVFSRQTVSTVGQVAGMAGAVQRGTTAFVAGAVGVGLGNPAQNAARLGAASAPPAVLPQVQPEPPPVPDGARFRSPYRLDEGVLYLLDQRQLPDRIEEIACHRAADVAFNMRMLAVNGAPLLAQVAAYGVALTADEARTWQDGRRRAELRRAHQLLTHARPAAHAVRAALARMEARTYAIIDAATGDFGDALADGLMAEADAIATRAATDHATIAHHLAELLRHETGGQLRVVVFGDPGLMTTGQVGTAVPALGMLSQEGVAVRAWLPEARPRLEGARLAAWELRNAGVEYTVIADAALAWLFASEAIDAVLVTADWISPTGDFVATIGTRAVAELAAAGLGAASRPIPAYVVAPSSTVAAETFEATSIPTENRPGRELTTDHGSAAHRGTNAVNPAVELVPKRRVSAFISELGVHRPPFGESLPKAGPD